MNSRPLCTVLNSQAQDNRCPGMEAKKDDAQNISALAHIEISGKIVKIGKSIKRLEH